MITIQIPTKYYDYNHNLPFSWQEVILLKGQRNYTVFVLENGSNYISSKSIGNYENFLPNQFLRVHKCCIVRKDVIRKICKNDHKVILNDGFEHQISRRRWSIFRELLEK